MSGFHCQKPGCGAGEASLDWGIAVLEGGQREQYVKCIKCGWQISRPEPPQELRYHNKQGHQINPSKYPRSPCTRVGCNGSYAINGGTKYKLCPDCSYQLEKWRKQKKQTDPPFVQVKGKWYDQEQIAQHIGAIA